MDPKAKIIKPEALDQISYEMSVVIQNGWCGRPPNTYGAGTPLGQLWSQSFPNVPFIPNGAMALIAALHKDSFFAHCAKAFALTVGMFAQGGALQTVLDLYYWLKPCQTAGLSNAKFSTFLAAALPSTKKRPKKAGRNGRRKST